MRIRRRILLSVLGVLIAFVGVIGIFVYRAVRTFDVAISDSAKGTEPGALVSVKQIAQYPAFVAQLLLSSVGLPAPISVSHGITLYRVTYRTTNFDGSGVVASGLVALPNDAPAARVVVYHHGTIVHRNTAPSSSRFGEGALVAAAVTGNGGILIAPDYIGLGESHALHPYMCAKSTSTASIDFLRAARTLVEHLRGEWPGSLCLMGFSQGGMPRLSLREISKNCTTRGFW